MPRRKLTALSVAQIRAPGAGRLEIWDAIVPGLGLRVTPTGHKSWCVFTRAGGKMRRITLGRYPDLELIDARAKARQMLAALAAGEPIARKDTVRQVVAGYIERQAKRNRTWRETERTLNRELADWMDRPLAKITRRDVIEILDRTAARAPYLANRLRSQLSTLFKWAIGRGIVNASPVTGIAPPGAEESRDRFADRPGTCCRLASLRRAWLALWPDRAAASPYCAAPRRSRRHDVVLDQPQ
jgi:hypothetical protein